MSFHRVCLTVEAAAMTLGYLYVPMFRHSSLLGSGRIIYCGADITVGHEHQAVVPGVSCSPPFEPQPLYLALCFEDLRLHFGILL